MERGRPVRFRAGRLPAFHIAGAGGVFLCVEIFMMGAFVL
jgi:hypothetical protein